MPHLTFDMRPCLNAVWVERYRSYLGEARARWDDKRRENTQFGVEQSTVRSIPTGLDGPKHGPLAVYNEWAGKQLTLLSKSRERWGALHQRAEFERWHAELTESLCRHWKQRTEEVAAERTKEEGTPVEPVNSELSIAHRYKLVDLFVRWLRMKGEQAPELAAACVANGHVPLDRKSLHVLSETFGGIGLRGPFSMGHVHTQGAYEFYQALARAVCAEAGGSPLLFDVFAWNHPEAQALYGK
jgi:hypothetical protein